MEEKLELKTVEDIVTILLEANAFIVYENMGTQHACDICGKRKDRVRGAGHVIAVCEYLNLKEWNEDPMSDTQIILGSKCLEKVMKAYDLRKEDYGSN